MNTILIVDDNRQNLYMLQSLLSGNGYTVMKAANGEDALRVARETPPQLIISDILMPVMDGFALCKRWQADKNLCRIPFVFYTATYTEPQDRELALNLGAVRFIVKPEEPDRFVEIIHDVIADQQNAKLPRGKCLPVENGSYLKEYNERLIHKLEQKMMALEHEISERKRSEQALRESEEKYRLLVDNANEAIFVIQDQHFRFVNSRVEEVLGASFEEIKDIPFHKFVHPEDRNIIVERHERRIQGKEVLSTSSFRIINRQGDKLWLHLNSIRISWQGNPATLNFARDITREKNYEKQLLCSQKLEAMGALAGGIAHDFNNILAVIIGFSEIARTELPPGSKIGGDIDNIIIAAKRGAELIEQILAFSRQEADQFKALRLQDVIGEVILLLRASLPSTIELKVEVADSVGPILADSTQMHQVLMNLCTNARYAIAAQPGVISIMLTEQRVTKHVSVRDCPGLAPGNYLVLTVSDTGCGMDETTQAKIFDPFFTTKEKGQGSGLGLSVAHSIIRHHKGEIVVDSRVGEGTRFRVYLPVLEEAALGAVVRKSPGEEKMPQGRGEKILLVDDEELVVSMMEQMLDRMGYRVTSCTGSLAGLEVLNNQPGYFDLLITDMTMPDMTGADLAREALALYPKMRVIICTGFSEAMDESAARSIGINSFLQKPVSMKSLAAVVREVLDKQ